jgi:endoglucanase
MKRLILFLLTLTVIAAAAEAPFSKGVNITGWFQTSGTRQVQFTKFTKQDFLSIQSLGCDVIRLPIDLQRMTNGAPDYIIDPLFFFFMDQVIDWAEELHLYLMLDNHAVDAAVFTDPNLETMLKIEWTQMAQRYKNRSTYILYEIINEPHDISDAKWGAVQKNVIDAIRAVDTMHMIVVTPAGWGGYNSLPLMPHYTDENLLYSFHFYDPFLFTHQGASWASPSLASLAGVPFPYDAARMPACPPDLKGTWVEGSLNSSYRNDGTEKKIKELLGTAIRFRDNHNVPIFCGEFGVFMQNSDNEDRVRWYGVVPPYLTEQKIPWTMWDYTGGFGLFEKGGNDMFEYDVNVPLVEAMGLQAPEQKEFILKSDTTGFNLYTDFIGENTYESSSPGSGTVNFYSEDQPAKGNFCIKMADVDQYNNTGFGFKPMKDMTLLVQDGYALDLYVRSDNEEMKFDIRFIDTKTDDPDDHPWRIRMTIDKNMAKWEGDWVHLQLPLSEFTEHGSWDNNAWYNPIGAYDWGNVQRLEIVSEHSNFKGQALYIDNIRIVDPAVVAVDERSNAPRQFSLAQNYPNPFNPNTIIHYELPEQSAVLLQIFDIRGRLVETLVNAQQPAGVHSALFSGERLPSGAYFCQLTANDRTAGNKMLLLR